MNNQSQTFVHPASQRRPNKGTGIKGPECVCLHVTNLVSESVCVCVYIFVCVCVCVCVCLHMSECVLKYIYIYIYIYMYIYSHLRLSLPGPKSKVVHEGVLPCHFGVLTFRELENRPNLHGYTARGICVY
jgi:hypothetical protein